MKDRIDIELFKYYDKIRQELQEGKKRIPFVRKFKQGRNEPCPCGSELKFKKCCLDKIR